MRAGPVWGVHGGGGTLRTVLAVGVKVRPRPVLWGTEAQFKRERAPITELNDVIRPAVAPTQDMCGKQVFWPDSLNFLFELFFFRPCGAPREHTHHPPCLHIGWIRTHSVHIISLHCLADAAEVGGVSHCCYFFMLLVHHQHLHQPEHRHHRNGVACRWNSACGATSLM